MLTVDLISACISLCSSPLIISGGSQGEGAEAAGVFYGRSSRDNLFSDTPLLALFYDIINSSISSDQP